MTSPNPNREADIVLPIYRENAPGSERLRGQVLAPRCEAMHCASRDLISESRLRKTHPTLRRQGQPATQPWAECQVLPSLVVDAAFGVMNSLPVLS